ncbi:hypothetical protein [Microseira wollei]|uniref:TonB C-terminal domain-containing protein n=1 Tax=Microseira wollei NIES-4236 TaxID=2530354 RepID=A0AAV3X6A8_9CYAN|nr:hypothetical protein [Microseira wollei]GET36883.1 hypothetical protein MiSe_16350 [Microseira wollei NIES-4236]
MAKKRTHPSHPTKPRLAAYTPPAMSDAELFRPQPETSTLPNVLASVFSLSLHGLLWVAPPIFSMSRQKPDFQRTVDLVQLTPAEISRLQEFSTPVPVVSLPPLPPPLPPTDVLPPPSPPQQPSTQTLEKQEELVRQQIVQKQQELLQKQLQQQEELFQQRMRQQEELLQKQKLEQQAELRRELEREKQRQTEQMRQELELEKQRQAQQLRREMELENQRKEQLRQLQEQQRQAELERLQQQEKERQQILGRQIEEEKKRQEIFRRQRELEVLDEWEQQEKLLVQLQKQLQQGQKSEDLKRMYGYNADGTKVEASRNNVMAFYKKIEQFAGEQKNWHQEKISIRLVSPIKQNLPDVNPAGVALLIDENGNLSTDPLLTRSTGYPALNEAAIKAAIDDVKKRSFPPAGEKKVYLYEIEIEQNNEASR